MQEKYSLAKHYFYEKSYVNACDTFLELKMPYEAGLCVLLLNKPKEAHKIWRSQKYPSIATNWALMVFDYIHLKWNYSPTYFQVRAFLEVYLNLLIENSLYTYAENLISAQNILAKSNPETFKFIARVLFSHGYIEHVPEFIALSKKCCYMDPEIHFIEAQLYCEKKDYSKALCALDETLTIVGDYFPALSLKYNIEKELKAKL